MKCPNCTNTNLVMSERKGVEIDYCPECRGIWLDRGELDKIIDKSMSNDKESPFYQHNNQNFKEYKHHDNHEYHKHRKKNWLSDLFD